MLVPMRAILAAADKYRYGQGAFNMNSVGQIEAAVRIHELLHSGAILQGAEASNAFMGGELDFMHGTLEAKKVGAKRIGDAVKKYGADSPVPIALHLDHGKSIESVKACIDGGYTSVMIDGSSLPYEQNVELTREVVKLAHPYGVSVEGELGVLAGVEDHVFSATSTYTNPMQAVDFFKKTGCDALAISYGTCHGANKGKDTKIRREIAIATKECMLHEGIEGYAGQPRLFHRAAGIRSGHQRAGRPARKRLRHRRGAACGCGALRHQQDQRGYGYPSGLHAQPAGAV